MIVLAAGQGGRLRPLTEDRPKALVPFMGRPILDWTIAAARENGVGEIVVVGGHRSDLLPKTEATILHNPDYATTSPVGSLIIAEEWFGDAFIVSYGDIVFRPEVLGAVMQSTAEIGVVVDMDWQKYWERRFGDPFEDAESLRMTPDGTIRSIGQTVARLEDVQARFVGLVVFRGRGVKAIKRALARAKTDAAYRRPVLGHKGSIAKLALADVLDELAVSGDIPVKAIQIHGGWADIDRPEDLAIAEERWSAGAARPVVEPPPAAAPVAGATTAGSWNAAAPGQAVPAPAAAAPAAGSPPVLQPFVAPMIFRSPSRRW